MFAVNILFYLGVGV